MAGSRWISFVVVVTVGLFLAACGMLRGGADYPSREVTYIVPYAAGGGSDLIARTVNAEVEKILNQKVVTVNKSSPAGTLGVVDIVQSKPDGYTIGQGIIGPTALAPLLEKLPYDTPEDYQPIVKMVEQSPVFVVRGDAPWKTFEEFLADARKRPKQLRVGTTGRLGLLHLTAEKIKLVAKADIVSVPFAGGEAEVIKTLLGGHLEAGVTYPPAIGGQLKAGELRMLTPIQKERSPLVPEVPSIYELGYPIKIPTTQFVIGPKGIDKAIVDQLNRAYVEAVKTPKFQELAQKSGLVVDLLGPAELAKEIMEFRQTFTELLRELNVEIKK